MVETQHTIDKTKRCSHPPWNKTKILFPTNCFLSQYGF